MLQAARIIADVLRTRRKPNALPFMKDVESVRTFAVPTRLATRRDNLFPAMHMVCFQGHVPGKCYYNISRVFQLNGGVSDDL